MWWVWWPLLLCVFASQGPLTDNCSARTTQLACSRISDRLADLQQDPVRDQSNQPAFASAQEHDQTTLAQFWHALNHR